MADGPFTEPTLAAAEERWTRARRHRSSPALFDRSVPERLTRGHPVLPYVVLGPVALGCLVVGAEPASIREVTGALWIGGWFGLGWLGWTLLEYLMHRFLFHLPRRTLRAKVFAYLVHGHHHIYPDDRSRIAATPIQFLSMTLVLAGLFLPFGSGGVIAFAGALAGYLVYETVHYQSHYGRPRTALGRALRRHHLTHHFRADDSRWGISSPLWDWIFRTHRSRSSGS